MSAIPNSAMPHAYVHDDGEADQQGRRNGVSSGPSTGMLVGGAVAAFLLYRILR